MYKAESRANWVDVIKAICIEFIKRKMKYLTRFVW